MFKRLRDPDREELLIERGVPEVWRRSIAETVAVVAMLDQRLILLEPELGSIARAASAFCSCHHPRRRGSAG